MTPTDLKQLETLIRDAMSDLEGMPMGGVGEDGPGRIELDAAAESGKCFSNDASFHTAQSAWLRLREALKVLEVTVSPRPR